MPISLKSLFVAAALTAIIAIAPSTQAQSAQSGYWQLRYDPSTDRWGERVQLTFEDYDRRFGHRGSTSFGVTPSQLQGVTVTQLANSEGAVRFRLVRDAGTFNFEGQLYHGRGNGSFTFTPDPRFAQEMSKRGYQSPSAEQQFLLAMHDVGYALVDELRTQGYSRPSVDDLVTMGMHGVRFDYVRGMGSLGYRFGDTDKLVELRDHGVTPAFVTGLAFYIIIPCFG